MHYTKEGTIEVREDIFNQLREENSLLMRENVILRNKLDVAIRLCEAWKGILERRKTPPIKFSDFQGYEGQSELLMGKNYEPQFENGFPKYKLDGLSNSNIKLD